MGKKTIFLCAAFFLAVFTVRISGMSDNSECSHYNVQLKIIPEKQYIEVEGSLKYIVRKNNAREISFYLHRNLAINKFSVNGDTGYYLDTGKTNIRWMPDAVRIIYSGDKKFHKGEVLNIRFSYEGRITDWPPWSANVLTAGWIEMGMYFPWYPSIDDSFTYRVAVDINPAYKVFAIGEESRAGNSIIFENRNPVDDLIICAAKDLRVREIKLLGRPFKIVNCTLSNTTIDSIQTDIKKIYDLYEKWFGRIPINDMCVVISKRKKGGGYSRTEGLFLGGLSNSNYLMKRTGFVRYAAHEIAHSWWHGAAGNWQDWLNESFAEYSALRIVKALRGQEEFTTMLAKKRKESANTPPIRELKRSDPAAEKVLYGKGVVLLNELDEKIDDSKFFELSRDRIRGKINNTDDFLKLVNDKCGEEISGWLRDALKNE